MIYRLFIIFAANHRFLSRFTAVVAGCLLAIGCSTTLVPQITHRNLLVQPLAATTAATKSDSLSEAINYANRAATLAQTARSAADWDEVAQTWLSAIASLQAIPPDSPQRVYAQKKIIEYMAFLQVAQQRAAATSFQLKYPTFNNQLLDNQLVLYLSYIAALGPPDILIVGSSRSLQGVDPKQMQQALAGKGFGGLKIFNFGVNGATVQVIDLLLRKILTEEQLPKLIVWADGVRAFNSGRVDRTYNLILASPGYKRLLTGNRPLSGITPSNRPDTLLTATPPPNLNSVADTNLDEIPQNESQFNITLLNSQPSSETILAQNTLGGLTPDYSAAAIDANGFLPVSIRFNPAIYYRQKPRVAGAYDSDYSAFQLGGKQEVALNNLMVFAKQRRIPVFFINLPLSRDYLDRTRLRAEQQFRPYMVRQSSAKGFIFLDLSRQWTNQNGYFADPSHLNRYGAAVIGRQIAADTRIPWPR
ncbi:hypothetical protein [Coleofasciculus sp. FACHB-129]|uniref:hypothetical protein n=1 Tax=Cyanophyceae TaxID=3028117 RepID=UPI001686B4DF|nr:hypothetical protein [Coleofasciculus sp. FACHB-129]MBD1898001.1 hypothetical protein [Coleofasciculus sp. FACHB-129]